MEGSDKTEPLSPGLGEWLIPHVRRRSKIWGCKSNAFSPNAVLPVRLSNGVLASTNPNCSCSSVITTFIKVENLCREQSYNRFFFSFAPSFADFTGSKKNL